MSEQFNIDDFLRNAMDEFEVQPRITSFDAVQKKLLQNKKRRILYIFFSGFGLLLLSFFTYLFLLPASVPQSIKAAAPGSKKNDPSAQTTEITHALPQQPAASAGKSTTHHSLSKSSRTTTAKTDMPVTSATRKPLHTDVATVSGPSKQFITTLPATESSGNVAENPKQVVANQLETPVLDLPTKTDSLASTLSIDSTGPIKEEAPTLTSQSTPIKKITADSIYRNKDSTRFFVGVFVQPQYSSLLLSAANQLVPGSFEQMYLANRKEQLAVTLNYALGLTAGYKLNSKWELWIKAGYQNLHYYEKLTTVSPLTLNGITGLGASVQNYNASKQSERGFKNEFSYGSLGLKASRLFYPNPFVKLVLDAGIHTNYLLQVKSTYVSDSYNYEYTENIKGSVFSKLSCNTFVNFGVIKDLNSKLQARITPGVFAAPTSMFKKDYFIKQRPYGLALECVLVYKLTGKK